MALQAFCGVWIFFDLGDALSKTTKEKDHYLRRALWRTR
jgi:hypothetical protein